LVAAHRGRIVHEDFAAQVTVTAQLAVEDFPAFGAALQEMSGGTLRAEVVETDDSTIMPVDGEVGTEGGGAPAATGSVTST
jgi:hypothetical protein